MGFDLWSTTPASNDMANYFQTGMRPSAVKTAGWDIQADLASMYGLKGVPAATGTANAIAVANARPFAALHVGCECWFFATATNTGAATFSPDGLTAKSIIKNGGVLTGGEIANGGLYCVRSVGASGSDTVLQWNIIIANGAAITSSDIASNTYSYAADTGSVNALAITTSANSISVYANGQSVSVKVANTTTNSTPTLAVNALAAKNIYYSDGVTQLLAGSLILNNIYQFIYNSSLNSGAGGWICINPSRINGSFTLTIATGLTTTPTGTVNYGITPDGKSVYIYISSSINGTSNSSTMTGTGVPSLILTANSGILQIILEDSGGSISGIVGSLNSSTWTFGKSVGGFGGFTTTGTKGLNTPSGGGVWPPYPLF